MVSVPSCFSFTTRHKGSSLHHPLDESNLLPHEGMGCTNLTHSPTASIENPSLLRAMAATSSPAVTALAPCVCNLEHMYFSQDYKCLHRCTENTLSWTFFYWNISNLPKIINMEVIKECCNSSQLKRTWFLWSQHPAICYHQEWCFREERDTVLPLPPTAH